MTPPSELNMLEAMRDAFGRKELNKYHQTKEFSNCNSMGDILETNLRLILSDHVTKFELI